MVDDKPFEIIDFVDTAKMLNISVRTLYDSQRRGAGWYWDRLKNDLVYHNNRPYFKKKRVAQLRRDLKSIGKIKK